MSLRAFTLVELLVVVFILGVMATVAVPRLANSLVLQRIDSAGARIVADLALARRHARLSGTSETVTFTTAPSGYAFSTVTDPNHPSQTYSVSLGDEPYGAVILSVNFGGDAALVFDGYGVPDSGGSVVIQVGSYQVTISVDADSGRATAGGVS